MEFTVKVENRLTWLFCLCLKILIYELMRVSVNFKRKNKFVFTKIFHAVPNYAISGQMGLERGGHDLEPLQNRQSL